MACPSKIEKKESALRQVLARLRFSKVSIKLLVLVVIVAIISIAVSALVAITLSDSGSEVYLPSVGTIKTIGVETYWDQNGKNKIEELSWDQIKLEKQEWDEITMKPISSTVYVKSVSNFRVTMDIFVTDWSPAEISDYLTVLWDYEGEEMDPGDVIPVTLTLSAPSSDAFIDYILENNIQSFGVSIHFVATE